MASSPGAGVKSQVLSVTTVPPAPAVPGTRNGPAAVASWMDRFPPEDWNARALSVPPPAPPPQAGMMVATKPTARIARIFAIVLFMIPPFPLGLEDQIPLRSTAVVAVPEAPSARPPASPWRHGGRTSGASG